MFVTHWQPPEPWTDDKPACQTPRHHPPLPHAITGDRALVTCPDCQATDVWKDAP